MSSIDPYSFFYYCTLALRQRLRGMRQLEGTLTNDILCILCCSPCALCQVIISHFHLCAMEFIKPNQVSITEKFKCAQGQRKYLLAFVGISLSLANGLHLLRDCCCLSE